MKRFMLFVICTLFLNAQQVHDMTVGNWHTVTTSKSENRTRITEKEFLHLRADHTFDITILVTLKKGEHFIKDLQVKGSGIWKRYITTLVVVINKIEVPFAKEVSNSITPQSLQALASTYQARLKDNPIRINTITLLTKDRLTIVNEKGVKTEYSRYIPVKQKPIVPQKIPTPHIPTPKIPQQRL